MGQVRLLWSWGLMILALILLVFSMDSEPQICFDSTCYTVEVADTPEERVTGLMHRESLSSGSGMLFVFEGERINRFWMKNTLIPLDMIWIDSEGWVIHIETAQPCITDPCQTYGPDRPSLYVLEVPAGEAEKNGIRVGSRAVLFV